MQESDLQKVRHYVVEPDAAGQRIDNYLRKLFGDVPTSHVYRIIRTGQVRVNRGRVKPASRLQAGDEIRVPPLYHLQSDTTSVPSAVVDKLEAAILHEDDELLVLNKPSGLAVHGGSGLSFGVIEALRQSRDNNRLELIHRLDRQTSGCLLVGKTLKATRNYQDVFRQRGIIKEYRAVVVGPWLAQQLQVHHSLSSDREISGERMVVIDPNGKTAESFFTTLAKHSESSEMTIRITTGRTHQIRVHAASQGHPIVGDVKYGNKAMNKMFRRLGLKRLFLHAESLQFSDGRSFFADTDADWKAAVAKLKPD